MHVVTSSAGFAWRITQEFGDSVIIDIGGTAAGIAPVSLVHGKTIRSS